MVRSCSVIFYFLLFAEYAIFLHMDDLLTREEKIALGFLIGVTLAGMVLLGFVGRPQVPRPPAVVLMIHINQATSAELVALPGIGPVLAQRIVDDRNRNGYYVALQDLTRVKGVTPKLLHQIKDLIRFD